MLTEMKVSQDRTELRLTRLEEKDGRSPRDKVSSSLFVDVVNTEWDQAGRSIAHSTPGPPSLDSKERRQRDEVYTKGGQRTDTEESLNVESTETEVAYLPFRGEQLYNKGLLTGVVQSRRKEAGEKSFIADFPKHVGHTKVTTAPVSEKRQQTKTEENQLVVLPQKTPLHAESLKMAEVVSRHAVSPSLVPKLWPQFTASPGS